MQRSLHQLANMIVVAPAASNLLVLPPWHDSNPLDCRYEGKGLFLEPPSVGMTKGVWHIKLPAALDGVAGALDLQFPTRDAVFSASRC